ncbi:MAG: hypothetical protein JXB43_02580 [Dehalococcoidia bacterium]|nr:hypothetical protein [Dehalococcoidia bacterium]
MNLTGSVLVILQSLYIRIKIVFNTNGIDYWDDMKTLRYLLVFIVIATFLLAGCVKSTEKSLTSEADTIFRYGRVFSYWTNDGHLAGDQSVKGLSSWRLEQLMPSVIHQGSQVVLSSPYVIPDEANFQPEKVEINNSIYTYTIPFKMDETVNKPKIVFIPNLSNTWSKQSIGLDIDANAEFINQTQGIENITIKITPLYSFNHIWISIVPDDDFTLITNTASPEMNQWNIQNPQVKREYIFNVHLQVKDTSSLSEIYKPGINITAETTQIQQAKQSGISLGVEVPGLGSLTFQAAEAGVLEVDRADQLHINLWQSSTYELKYALQPPINGWGFCRNFDAQQNPDRSSLLFLPEDNHVTFWADIDLHAFGSPIGDSTIAVELEWIDPKGQNYRTQKINLPLDGNGSISDAVSIGDLDASKLGTWHVTLKIDDDIILTSLFVVSTPEEILGMSIDLDTNVPHFVAGDQPFHFIGAYVPDGLFDQMTADRLISTAKMSGLNVLTLGLPSSQNYGDESSLRQLDVFLDRASAHGVYIIVSMMEGYGISMDKTNLFHNPGGVEGLIYDQKLRSAYKDLITRVVTRKNTVNGRLYRDDPTIMAWDVISEPVPPGHQPIIPAEDFSSWLQEMTGHIRSLDPNHLVTMMIPGPINEHHTIKGLPEAIMANLDFFWDDTNIYDMLYLNNQPMTKDYIDYCCDYPVFSLGMPVVPTLSFTAGENLDKEFAANYELQGQIYSDALIKGFQKGMAGAMIFSWGTKLSEMPWNWNMYYLIYDITDEQIIVPILKVAAVLNTIDLSKSPLQSVKIAP